MSQPIGEFLQSKNLGRLGCEEDHPTLGSEEAGRPKQVDYAIIAPETKELIHIFEVKYVVRPDTKRIIHDLLRLECAKDAQRTERYFLLAAQAKIYDQKFKEYTSEIGGIKVKVQKKFLNFTTSKPKKLEIKSLPKHLDTYMKGISNKYGIDLPNSIFTKRIRTERDSHYVVTLWKVSSTKNRKIFHKSSTAKTAAPN